MAENGIKLPYKLPSFHDWQPHATFYHPLYAGSIDGTDLYPHDRAVVRAILSRYQPNKNVTGDQSKTLFVARLSKDTNQDTIESMFEKYGELEKCRLIRDFVTGFSRGYAFVEFKRKKDALNAARETHKMNIDGKQILVDFECERHLDGWKPRRFGGGFGGRKESGQLRFGGIDRPFRRPIPDKVNQFNRGGQHEDNARSRESKGDHEKLSRDNERHERNRDEYDKDRKARGQGRDHWDNKSNDRDKYRDREEHDRGSRDCKHRDYRSKKEYQDTQKDYRRHDRRDRDDHYRERGDRHRDRDDRHRDRDDRYRDRGDHYRDKDDRYSDRNDRYRDRRHKDIDSSRNKKVEERSGSSNSSRDPD